MEKADLPVSHIAENKTPFRIGPDGRPEGTTQFDKGVLHYTCNSPNIKILGRFGITPMGNNFGIDDNEVLLIPNKLFADRGISEVNPISAEALLAKLGRQRKKQK